ncbi:MAG TPA: hypothetical protein DCZ11_03780 [Gammaproteobacteria bacterium]|nr:hypothetical protein [Gammaproteobacteria bacterium]MCH77548.1 hypothetical protein [Gammaproteobacteria bacterium]
MAPYDQQLMPRGLRRRPAARKTKGRSLVKTFPAPTRGWVTNQNLAAKVEGSALVMDNWFPTKLGARVRGGGKKVATIGSDPVERLFSYDAAGDQHFFAASETDIYDITIFDAGTAPSADVSSLTSGAWSVQQIGTAGGTFLVCVNGADTPRAFDGTNWSTATITGVTAANLNHVTLYRNRLYFVEKDSLSIWYLSAGAYQGAATELSLKGVFQKGGSLLFVATWSTADSGEGKDDFLVAVSNHGEVAVYSGAYPGDSSWDLVGRYEISPPLGPNAYMRAGGDLVIATYDGLVPISQAIALDKDALALAAISYPIEPNWRYEVQASNIDTKPWELVRFPREDMLIVSLPHTGERLFVCNLHTGAWARYVGWNAQSLGMFNNFAYFGDGSGSIYRCESGGQDGEAAYTAKLCLAFDDHGSPAAHKQALMARATMRAFFSTVPKISVAADYDTDFPAAPNAYTGAAVTGALWGTAIWGTSLWGDEGDSGGSDRRTVSTRWRSVTGAGFVLAPQIQLTIGAGWKPDAEFVAFDLLYDQGEIVV